MVTVMRELVNREGLTYEMLEKQIGLSRQTINDAMNGAPTVMAVGAFAKWLGCSVTTAMWMLTHEFNRR